MPRLKSKKTAVPKKAAPKRFTKAAAEKAGWVFTHNAGQELLSAHETQNVLNIKPASVTAEKYVDRPGATAQLVTETAESLEQLLLQIESYEQHIASRGLG